MGNSLNAYSQGLEETSRLLHEEASALTHADTALARSAGRGAIRLLTEFQRVFRPVFPTLHPNFDDVFIAKGAESLVFANPISEHESSGLIKEIEPLGEHATTDRPPSHSPNPTAVTKILSGKTMDAEKLGPMLDERFDVAKQEIGESLVDTRFFTVTAQPWRGAAAGRFVAMEQPWIDIEAAESGIHQRDPSTLGSNEDTVHAMHGILGSLNTLARQGIYYDLVNGSNTLRTEEDLILLPDTVLSHADDSGPTGIWLPLWSNERIFGSALNEANVLWGHDDGRSAAS